MSAAERSARSRRLPSPTLTITARPRPPEFFPADAIADAKAEILRAAPRRDRRAERRRPTPRRIGERFAGRTVWFGRDRSFDVSAERWRGTAFGMRFDLRVAGRSLDVALPLAGPHFVENFLAAAAAAHVLGIPPETIADKALRLKPARHRGELLRLGDGVLVLDDCYNSSPMALEAAVVALGLVPGLRRVALLGDMLELGATGPALHREAGRALAGRVDVLAGIGPLSREIVEGARAAGFTGKGLVHFEDAAQARRGREPRGSGRRRAREGLARHASRAGGGGTRGSLWEDSGRSGGGAFELMLYHLLYSMRGELSVLNVTRYITFRTAVAALTALFLVLVLGPWVIERLRRLSIGQYIREEGPQAHKSKAGTPTMGGVLILVGILVPTLLWADLTNRSIWILVLSTLAYGLVGFAHDYIKVVQKRSLGLPRASSPGSSRSGCGGVRGLRAGAGRPRRVLDAWFPFFKQLVPDLGLFYIVFAVAAHAIVERREPTDRLDGLAIGTTLIAAAAFTGLAYVTSHFASPSTRTCCTASAGEVTVFRGADGGRRDGLPVVELLAQNLHGRRRQPRAWGPRTGGPGSQWSWAALGALR